MTDIDKAAREAWDSYDIIEPIGLDSFPHFLKGFRAGAEWRAGRKKNEPRSGVLLNGLETAAVEALERFIARGDQEKWPSPEHYQQDCTDLRTALTKMVCDRQALEWLSDAPKQDGEQS